MADGEKKLVFKLIGDSSGLTKAFNKTKNESNNLSQTMGKLGGVIAGAFAVGSITAFATSIGSVGMEFESQMSKVKAISGATAEDFAKLEAEAKRMGESTKFSAYESAQGLEKFAMAGWNAKQSIDALEPTLKLAQASGTDLGITADILSDAMTGFKMSSEDAGKFADLLASVTSKANTNVTMLGESFKYIAPVMGTLKGSAEDTALALGLMANAGIKGSQAGTSLKTGILNLVSPTAQMKAIMDEMGIAVQYNADGSLNLKATLDLLRETFALLTPEQQASAGATLFGKEAMAGMMSIVSATTTDYKKLSDATSEYSGLASEQADIMGNNLKGRIDELKSAWEGVQLMLYDYVLPVFEKVVEWLKILIEWVRSFEASVKDNFDLIQKKVSGFVAFFEEAKQNIITIFENMKKAVLEWYEKNKENVDRVIEAFKVLAKNIGEVVNLILELLGFFIDMFTKNFLDQALIIIDQFSGAFNGLVEMVKGVLKIIKGLFQGDWKMIWEGALDVFNGFTGMLDSLWKGAINSIISKVNGFIRALNKIQLPDFLGGYGVNISEIPMLAEGGIVTKPTLAMIGEGSESEAVIPLSKLAQMSGGKTANIIVELDGNTLAQAIGEPLVEQMRIQTGMAI